MLHIIYTSLNGVIPQKQLLNKMQDKRNEALILHFLRLIDHMVRFTL